MRIDKYLVEKGYFPTRNKAVLAIINKAVYLNDKLVLKPSLDVIDGSNIKIDYNMTLKYVSKGGLKLEGAINNFHLDFEDKIILDIGSSTGGFTDCALKHGAKFVYAVDVGSNQLDKTLRSRKDIMVLENTNILSLPTFSKAIDIVLMDASFVSVENLLTALDYYINENNYLVLLIKPQFEVGHIYLKGGIVKNKKYHLEVLEKVNMALNKRGLFINKICPSPILGGDGNKEFLALVSRKESQKPNFLTII